MAGTMRVMTGASELIRRVEPTRRSPMCPAIGWQHTQTEQHTGKHTDRTTHRNDVVDVKAVVVQPSQLTDSSGCSRMPCSVRPCTMSTQSVQCPPASAVPKLKPSAVSNAPPDAAALYGITDVTIGASYENARGSVPMACATVTAVWSWPAAPRGTEQRSVVVEMKVVVWHVPANPSYPLTSYRLF